VGEGGTGGAHVEMIVEEIETKDKAGPSLRSG
jgi:hypothetical protein